jgi:hypothetical protein
MVMLLFNWVGRSSKARLAILVISIGFGTTSVVCEEGIFLSCMRV